MAKISQMTLLIELEIKKVFRDPKYVFFIIAMPILFYILYNELFSSNAAVGKISWKEYSLVSMISFGIMGNAINLLGTKIANEKSKKWYTYLKVSPINTRMYSVSQVFSFFLISIIFTAVMFLIGYIYAGVNLSLLKMIMIGGLLNLGSIVFLCLGLLIGKLGSVAQPVGTLTYLFLSFLGGIWMPIDVMSDAMKKIAQILPSYHYAKLGWDQLANKGVQFADILNLMCFSIVFLIIFYFTAKEKT